MCVAQLALLRSPEYSGDCWGYPFDWGGRHGRLASGTPTIVATGIVTNALFVADQVSRLPEALKMCASATRFARRPAAQKRGHTVGAERI
jgi:hypothetical protein